MKTLIVYYSYSGHTKKIAEALAEDLKEKGSADIVEVKPVKRPGKLKAYTIGCFLAMRGRPWEIKQFDADMSEYDKIFLLSPVWAGNPPPFVYAAIKKIPEGKTVCIKMISGSGKSSCKDRIESMLGASGSTLEEYEDIKA